VCVGAFEGVAWIPGGAVACGLRIATPYDRGQPGVTWQYTLEGRHFLANGGKQHDPNRDARSGDAGHRRCGGDCSGKGLLFGHITRASDDGLHSDQQMHRRHVGS
jgi:hypothetical protein